MNIHELSARLRTLRALIEETYSPGYVSKYQKEYDQLLRELSRARKGTK